MEPRILIGWDGSDHARDARALAALLGPAPREETIEGGAVAEGLARLAREQGADFLVVGSDRRAGEGRVLAGHVAQRLLTLAPCAVAVAPAGYRDSAPEDIRVVGAGFDASPGSMSALRLAERIALRAQATIRVLAVDTHTLPPGTPNAPPLAPADAQAHDRLRVQLEEATAALDDRLRPEARLLGGTAAWALLDQAATGLDLLVLGSRGYGSLRRALLGSVASQVVRAAPCPVVVVRASQSSSHY